MSKGSKIKWKDSDIAELRRIVKNFNAKIDYVTKNKPHLKEFQPEKLRVKELKNNITTRQDLKRKISSVKRYSKKGAEEVKTNKQGVTATNYQIKETKINNRIHNQLKTIERKKLDIDVTKGNMGQIEARSLEPKKFNFENKSQKEWETFTKSAEKQIQKSYRDEKLEIYRDNYIKAIRNRIGHLGNNIIQMVENIDPLRFYVASINNPILSIDFPYDPQEAELIAEVIEHELSYL